MPGSSHSLQRALHCFGVFLASSDDTRAHCCNPYFETDDGLVLRYKELMTREEPHSPEAFKISSSIFVQTPPLTTGIVAVELWADEDAERVELLTSSILITKISSRGNLARQVNHVMSKYGLANNALPI